MAHRISITILLVTVCAAGCCATTTGAARQDKRVGELSRALMRSAEFVNVRHVSARPDCESVQLPEALTTPDPLFTPEMLGRRVKVSFIIGRDGRVHAPLILESAGMVGDRRALQTVRTWRYRPATCNGVPTETEGKVEFSLR